MPHPSPAKDKRNFHPANILVKQQTASRWIP
jgi:hypothetical protein